MEAVGEVALTRRRGYAHKDVAVRWWDAMTAASTWKGTRVRYQGQP